MAEVDTSSYNLLQPQKSMMENAGGFMALQNAANQNRLFQSKVSVGKAAQKSVNPLTGNFDQQKFNAGVAADPSTAAYAQEGLQAGQTLSTDQANLIHTQMDFLKRSVGALAVDPNLDWKKVQDLAIQLSASGSITPDQASTALTTLAPFQNDPEKLRGGLTSLLSQVTDAHTNYTKLYPAPQQVNVTNPDGSPGVAMTQTGSVPGVSKPTVIGAGQPQGGGEGAPAANTQGGPQINNGVISTGLPAGAQKNMEESAQQYQDFRSSMAGTGQRLYFLNEARKAVANTTTGTSQDTINAVKNFIISSVGPENAAKAGINADGSVNFELARKYMANVVSQQAASIGPGTNAGLEQAAMANPNEHLLNGTNDEVLKALTGLERVKQAQLAAFQKSGANPGQWSDFAANFGKNMDARAYMADLQDPAARAKMIAGMSDTEKKKYLNSLRTAINTGVLSLDDLKGK